MATPNRLSARGVDPKQNLDDIEAAMEMSRGKTVTITRRPDQRRKAFTSWKLDLIQLINADRRLKPDGIARVAIAILRHVNQFSYECYPSLPTIAEESSLSESTVKKAIVLLADLGYFVINKRGRKNVYSFSSDLKMIEAQAQLQNRANRVPYKSVKRLTTNTFS